MRPLDTDPEERAQLELLREATVARRVGLALSLSSNAIGRARDAIRKAHPGADEEEVGLRFVDLHYGPELGAEVRLYLAKRRG